jgi:hypothetical protein
VHQRLDVVKVIVYVTDFSWFDQLSELRERLSWPAGWPARSSPWPGWSSPAC